MAHRGFDLHGAENTIRAFRAALDLGVRYLETDVHATADGHLVAFHDERLDRVSDGRGLVARTPWRIVRQVRIGGSEPVPLLEELLEELPQARFNIDVKAASAIDPLVRVLERTQAYDRVCIASFSDARRRAVLRRLPRPVAASPGDRGVALAWLGTRLGAPGLRLAEVGLADTHCLQIPPRHGPLVVDHRFVSAIHRYGRQVHVWTINDETWMRRLLDAGVDALITDRSDIAVRVLAEWAR